MSGEALDCSPTSTVPNRSSFKWQASRGTLLASCPRARAQFRLRGKVLALPAECNKAKGTTEQTLSPARPVPSGVGPYPGQRGTHGGLMPAELAVDTPLPEPLERCASPESRWSLPEPKDHPHQAPGLWCRDRGWRRTA